MCKNCKHFVRTGPTGYCRIHKTKVNSQAKCAQYISGKGKELIMEEK